MDEVITITPRSPDVSSTDELRLRQRLACNYMRLTPQQIQTIRSATLHVAGQGASVWVYGSRLDDARRGGDLDLLVQSSPPISLLQRARIKNALEQQLNMPVDILAASPGGQDSAFVSIAKAQARRL